ncbi:MAG: hypothetical protein ACC742_12135 [Thermoanaerobaculales bacterium]
MRNAGSKFNTQSQCRQCAGDSEFQISTYGSGSTPYFVLVVECAALPVQLHPAVLPAGDDGLE